MQGAELEALRRLLFFSPPEAAALISGTSEQAWRRWESGARAVPDDVEEKIYDLVEWRKTAFETASGLAADAPANACIPIVWYASLDEWTSPTWRQAVLWRPHQSVVAALLAEFPGAVRLIRFDPAAYVDWLAGREDSEAMRGAWGGLSFEGEK